MSITSDKTPTQTEQTIDTKDDDNKFSRFICPIHGIVVAIPLGKDKITKEEKFGCATKSCDITRKRSELEYP